MEDDQNSDFDNESIGGKSDAEDFNEKKPVVQNDEEPRKKEDTFSVGKSTNSNLSGNENLQETNKIPEARKELKSKESKEIEEKQKFEETENIQSEPSTTSELIDHSDDVEQTKEQEYTEVITLIEAQNKIVESIKNDLFNKSRRYPRSEHEEIEIQNLYCCLEKENIKLHCLTERAMELQQHYSQHDQQEIRLITTFEEDNFPIRFNIKKKAHLGNEEIIISENESEIPDDEEDFDKFLSCLFTQAEKYDKGVSPHSENEEVIKNLLDMLRKKGIRPKAVRSIDSHEAKSQESESESRDFVIREKLQEFLKTVDIPTLGDSNQGNDDDMHIQSRLHICQKLLEKVHESQDKLVNDNSNLEDDRIRLQEQLYKRDKKIAYLQEKIAKLQNELYSTPREKGADNAPFRTTPTMRKQLELLKNIQGNYMDLQQDMHGLQSVVECLRNEVESSRKHRLDREYNKSDYWNENELFVSSPENDYFKYEPFPNDLKEQEKCCKMLLAQNYAKKSEIENLKEKIRMHIEDDDGLTKTIPKLGKSSSKYKIEMLRKKICAMQCEQEKFKNIFAEQAEQLKEYHAKYEEANQKAEEQENILKKVEDQNKRIENQINSEIQCIKDKFKEKLTELSEIPKLLENEKIKYAKYTRDKLELENKLQIMCKEFRELKRKHNIDTKKIGGMKENEAEMERKYKNLMNELEPLKAEYNRIKNEHDEVNCELQKISAQKDTVRAETASKIAKIKEKSEQTKKSMNDYIRRLQKELGECRKEAAVSIREREACINKMRAQLNTLSYSFDAAQQQIKILRNHAHKLTTPVETVVC